MATNGSTRILARRSASRQRDDVNRDDTAHVNVAAHPRSGRKAGPRIFLLLNFVTIVGVTLLSFLGRTSGHDPALYLILLVALLSSPLLFARSITGAYMLLGISAPFFFVMFGLGDLVKYFAEVPSLYIGSSNSILSYGESGVLVGFLCLFLGYAGAVGTLRSKSRRWFVSEWSLPTTMVVGLTFFAFGMIATFAFQIKFDIVHGHNPKLDALMGNALVLGRMAGALGEILLAYVLARTRSKTITIVIVALIIFKVPLGILLNSKEIGVSFIVTYLVVVWIYNKKIPWKITLVSGLIIALMFPLAYQYRAYMGKYSVSVGETLEDISGNLGKALSVEVSEQEKKGLTNSVLVGLESIAGRANVKSAVELIMARTGQDIEYQDGYTLSPILYIMIPRFIIPNKPNVAVGQLFNQEFKISASPDTYISTSFIGELYWNFSWGGIIIGMLVVGYTLGAVGSVANLDAKTNVVRVLIVLIAMATLVFKFETGIAQQYSLFIRSLIIIILMHSLFSKRGSKQVK